jgi:two-component system chemotaxis response regulator CheB
MTGTMTIQPKQVVIIGSSAGGPRVLNTIFNKLPLLKCCIIVVQHMPKFVNEHIRESLDALTEMHVKIAENDEPLKDGTVYIAPSEQQIELCDNWKIRLFDGDKINFVCPSVDSIMKSIHRNAQMKFIGVILTGMGKDGSEGISHMKKIGAVTIAQNQETSAIWGMPKEAIDTGDVDWVLSPELIHSKLIELINRQ